CTVVDVAQLYLQIPFLTETGFAIDNKRIFNFLDFSAFKNPYLSRQIVKDLMKRILLLNVLLYSVFLSAQKTTLSYEQYPIFPECVESHHGELESCFNFTLQNYIYTNFQLPEEISQKEYKGVMNVFFEVTKEGKFR